MTELVIRPSLENRASSRRIGELFLEPIVGIPSLFLFLGSLTLAIGGYSSWFAEALALVSMVGFLLFAASRLAFANVSLYVKDGRIGRTNLLGVRTEFPLDDVRRLELIAVEPSRAPVGPIPKLIVVSKSNQSLTQVASADYFSSADIRRLGAAAGLEVTGSWDTVVTSEELTRRYPESYARHSRRLQAGGEHKQRIMPARTRWLAVIGVVCVVIGIAAVPVLGNSAGASSTPRVAANVVSIVAFVLAIGCVLLLRLRRRS